MALRSPLTVQPYDYISDSTGRPLDKGQIYIGVANQDPEFYQIPVYLDAAMTKPIDQPIRTNDGFVDFAGSLSELYASAEVYSLKVLDKQGRKVIYKAEMMRDNLTDDALQSLNTAISESQQAAENTLNATVDSVTNNAINIVNDAINNTAVEGGVLADTFVTATVNGVGSVARTQRDKNSDIISVKDFGAKGDGVTDNTEAFRAAVGSLAGIGGEVVVPTAGVYLVRVTAQDEEAFVLPEGVSIRMVEGAWLAPVDPTIGGTFIGVKGNQRIQVNIDGRGMPDDGTITGVWKTPVNDNSNGLAVRRREASQVHNVEITGCVIHSLNYPIRPVGAVNWKIHQNTFYNYKQSGILFSFYEGMSCHGNLIHGNLFRNCGDTAVAFWPQAGFPAGGGSYNNTISSNVAEEYAQRTAGYAYDFESTAISILGQNHDNSVINNVASSTSTLGHTVGGIVVHLTKNSIVSGNHIRRVHNPNTNDDRGINANNTTGALIANNTITGVTGMGITSTGAEGATISGNSLTDCGSASGIYAAIYTGVSSETNIMCQNCTIANNYIEYTPGYLRTTAGAIAIGSRTPTINLKVSGNTIINPPDKAISLRIFTDDMNRNLQVVGNSIIGTGAEGFFTMFPIEVENVNSGLVERNYIYDSMEGLSTKGSNDLVVRNNVFKGERSIHNLYTLGGATDNLFEGNRCSQVVTSIASPSLRITDGSYGNRFKDNDIVITENGGLASVPSTTSTIQHGLIATPSTVTLMPTTPGVTGLTVSSATNSIIGVSYAEPSGPIEFYWEAKM